MAKWRFIFTVTFILIYIVVFFQNSSSCRIASGHPAKTTFHLWDVNFFIISSGLSLKLLELNSPCLPYKYQQGKVKACSVIEIETMVNREAMNRAALPGSETG